MSYWYLHRTLCDVLEEMRGCQKTLNFAPMASLIHECQILGNRMENGLGIKSDLAEMDEQWHVMKKRLKELTKEVDILEKYEEEKCIKAGGIG